MMERTGDWRAPAALVLWATTWLWLWADAAFLPLWPSLAALLIVFLVRRVITGILAGAAAGVIIIADGNPAEAFVAFFTEHLIPSLQSSWNISVLIFTLLLGGFVALIEHSGGLQGLIGRCFHPDGDRRKRVQWSTFALGLICFFDGLANSMLVGRSMRPLARAAGVSREKLAYLVDSTSAAVACVAFVSTWIAYQLSMIREGFALANQETNPYLLFLQSIPYNFYCWFTLLLVAVVILRNWNPGPMKAAEEQALNETEPVATHAPEPAKTTSPLRALVPLGTLLTAILGGLYLSGRAPGTPVSLRSIADAFGEADAATVLVTASAFACLTAFAFCWKPKQERRGNGSADAFLKGMTSLFVPALILVSAWTLSSTLGELETAAFLSTALEERLPLFLLPSGVFLTGMAIAFTTGTSWGTMGVLMPLALPVTLALTGDLDAAESSPFIAATVAAVFGGAVFGDHCSPLSDTTIVSSIACDLEPMEHVRTQIPYALIAAGTALILGYLPVGIGLPVWAGLPAGVVLIWLLPRIYSRKR